MALTSSPRAVRRVAFLGNLAGGAMMMAAPVARTGVDARLYLAAWEGALARSGVDGEGGVSVAHYGATALSGAGLVRRLLARIRTELSCLRIVPALMRADAIQSFTGSLFGAWSWIVLFGLLRLRPYIACATGSDLREVAVHDRGRAGWIMRLFFARAERVLLLNVDMVAVAEHLGLSQARFFPFAVNTRAFAPASAARTYGGPDDLLVFMPSHLDWGVVDNAPGRSSTKGNDRLIRAFVRFLSSGGKGHLLMLDRGPDRDTAHRLVETLGIAAHVTFRPHMSKAELVAHMNMADAVADQFDVGSFGTTGLEAMACGKPLLIRIDPALAARCYAEPPPLMNVRTEDEILAALWAVSERDFRRDLGARARDWVVRFHDEDMVARQLVDLYREVAA